MFKVWAFEPARFGGRIEMSGEWEGSFLLDIARISWELRVVLILVYWYLYGLTFWFYLYFFIGASLEAIAFIESRRNLKLRTWCD